MKYLRDDIQTLEELKKEYHRLCLKLHPDVGGSNEAMKELNAEYEIMFERVKRIHVNKDGERYEETPQEFQWLINELIKLDNITIEIIGCFIWVSGDTKPHKEKLKELRFKWHRKKGCWYRSPEGYRRWGGGDYSMDDIRSMYRTIQVNKDREKKDKEPRKALKERGWQV